MMMHSRSNGSKSLAIVMSFDCCEWFDANTGLYHIYLFLCVLKGREEG
jgi:hypothetical protein